MQTASKLYLRWLISASCIIMACNVCSVLGQGLTAQESFRLFKVWTFYKNFCVCHFNRDVFLQQTNNRTYTATENQLRFTNFQKTLQKVKEHNARFEKGQVSFKIAPNKFSDWTKAEYNRLLGFKESGSGRNKTVRAAPKSNLGALPASVDWRKKGWVSPVKNQGDCASCYTFSACGAIEGAYAKKYGKLIDCSEQNLLDCTFKSKYMNLGCDGGEMWTCFKYIVVEHTHDCGDCTEALNF